MNENKSTCSKFEFVCSFFGKNVRLKKSFRIGLSFSSFFQAEQRKTMPELKRITTKCESGSRLGSELKSEPKTV